MATIRCLIPQTWSKSCKAVCLYNTDPASDPMNTKAAKRRNAYGGFALAGNTQGPRGLSGNIAQL
ncbi:hypothetical protein GCM10007921_44810 [Tritonibacter mobilis]|nr:hypothetical protein GCM10007921_44810 [Tritonibacter mobilis]